MRNQRAKRGEHVNGLHKPILVLLKWSSLWYYRAAMMTAKSPVVYRSQIRLERIKGPIRKAYLPAEPEPVTFGVHGDIAEHYKVSPAVVEPHATTLDYIVAATAGWLTGTFGGALEARQIDASYGRLLSETEGEIELEDGVLVIRRIHVQLILKATPADYETALRVHGFFADRCPVYRTLKSAIQITTELVLVPETDDLILGDQGQSGGWRTQRLAGDYRVVHLAMKFVF
jgi:uncharacterized OsmC-like protein